MKIDGLPVKDALKKLTIEITPTDCKMGSKKQPTGCAAAIAIVRQVPSCTMARVHLGRTYVNLGKKWLRFVTPQALRAEIIAFDRGGTFDPGEYTLVPLSKGERDKRGKRNSVTTQKHGRPGHHRQPHLATGVRHHALAHG